MTLNKYHINTLAKIYKIFQKTSTAFISLLGFVCLILFVSNSHSHIKEESFNYVFDIIATTILYTVILWASITLIGYTIKSLFKNQIMCKVFNDHHKYPYIKVLNLEGASKEDIEEIKSGVNVHVAIKHLALVEKCKHCGQLFLMNGTPLQKVEPTQEKELIKNADNVSWSNIIYDPGEFSDEFQFRFKNELKKSKVSTKWPIMNL